MQSVSHDNDWVKKKEHIKNKTVLAYINLDSLRKVKHGESRASTIRWSQWEENKQISASNYTHYSVPAAVFLLLLSNFGIFEFV